MTPRTWTPVLPLAGLCLALVACGAAHDTRRACASPNGVGTTRSEGTRAKVGQIAYVALVEPELSKGGRGFPWMPVRSSNPDVLEPAPVCAGAIYSVPVEVYAFKALRPGSATLSAPLTAAWRAHSHLRAYSRTVTVTR